MHMCAYYVCSYSSIAGKVEAGTRWPIKQYYSS